MRGKTEKESLNVSYSLAFKSFSILGLSQFFIIITSIIKSKIIAVLLGTEGFGLMGMYNTTLDLIFSIFSFGIFSSSIRNIAEESDNSESIRLSNILWAVIALGLVVGIVCLILCMLFSPLLSSLTFGNKNFLFSFILLSLSLLFKALYSSFQAILQGLKKIKWLAMSNLYASLLGLILSIPLFYLFSEKGIVYSILLTSFLTLIFAYVFYKKINIVPRKASLQFYKKIVKDIVGVGFLMTFSGCILTTIVNYVLRIYILNNGGNSILGLYHAASSILVGYIGIVFNVLGTDYYPRLSSCNKNHIMVNSIFNNQLEISILVLVPLLSLIMLFLQVIINVLFTSDFMPIIPLIGFSLIGVVFKIIAFCISYIFLSIIAIKDYVITELIVAILTLFLTIVFYENYGLIGFGFAYLVVNAVYAITITIWSFLKFKISIKRNNYIIIFISMVLLSMELLFTIFLKVYVLAIIWVFISIGISTYILNRRLSLLTTIRKKLGWFY